MPSPDARIKKGRDLGWYFISCNIVPDSFHIAVALILIDGEYSIVGEFVQRYCNWEM